MRIAILRAVAPLILAGACTHLVLAQTVKKAAGVTKKPELKIEIISDKQTYSKDRSVFTETRFTNRSLNILCFPEPDQTAETHEKGFLSRVVLPPPNAPAGDQFFEHFDGATMPAREELIRKIKEDWIWLNPGGVHVSPSVLLRTELNTPGHWGLKAFYHPPEGSFNSVGFRAYLNSAARSAGCSIPQGAVSAEPVGFTVLP